jgi:hypothetical protein
VPNLQDATYRWRDDADPADAEFLEETDTTQVRRDGELVDVVDVAVCDAETRGLGTIVTDARALPAGATGSPYRVTEMDGDRVAAVTHGPDVTEEFHARRRELVEGNELRLVSRLAAGRDGADGPDPVTAESVARGTEDETPASVLRTDPWLAGTATV